MQSQPTQSKRQPTKGIVVRHSRSCESRANGECSCQPSYRAFVYVRHHGKKWATFATVTEAVAWREKERTKQRDGQSIKPTTRTLRQAAEEWFAGAKADPPTIRRRGGDPYKPSVIRSYEQTLAKYVLPDLGSAKLTDIRHRDLVELVERLQGDGLSASTIRNAIIPVRVIFRRAITLGEVSANPTSGLELPNGIGRRDRAASPEEAADLLAALPEHLRPVYACAFYAGLRRGELRGLRWADVDLASGIVTVRRGWDDHEGEIEPKSEKGTRTVPITALLRDYLAEHKARTGRDGRDFVFGAAADRPFTPSHVRRSAAKAWQAANEKERTKAKEEGRKPKLLQAIGLHECRHTFVSLLHDAGLSLERIGDYVGHSSTYMTDRYRHLLEGHEAEAARMLNEYLARADTRARVEQLEANREEESGSDGR